MQAKWSMGVTFGFVCIKEEHNAREQATLYYLCMGQIVSLIMPHLFNYPKYLLGIFKKGLSTLVEPEWYFPAIELYFIWWGL